MCEVRSADKTDSGPPILLILYSRGFFFFSKISSLCWGQANNCLTRRLLLIPFRPRSRQKMPFDMENKKPQEGQRGYEERRGVWREG
jgi:hypothetical protein